MTRPCIEIELAGYRSLARGYGSRGLVEEVSGRAPSWFRSVRGWSVTERVARDCIAAAEAKGWDVVVIGPRQASMAGLDRDRLPGTAFSDRSEQPDPGQGLW